MLDARESPGARVMFFPPYDDRFQYRFEALAFLCEEVFIAYRVLLVGPPGDKARALQFFQSMGKDV